jgi:xylose isomerase
MLSTLSIFPSFAPISKAPAVSRSAVKMVAPSADRAASKEYFADIPDIKYEGPDSRNPMAFKYYNADEVIAGRPMREWLRFAVAYWHTWRGNGADIFGISGSITRPWDGDTLEAVLERIDVNFEFCKKLGADYYCFHDRDVSPEDTTMASAEAMFDTVAAKLAKKQAETGIQLLWGTCNLFSHKRYMNGACTNPDPAVVCRAAQQVKKCLEVTHRLGGKNFVMWGGRDGYQTLLNTDLKREQETYAHFLRSVRDYAREIGFEGQLLLEPKPREPTAHQYNWDSATTLGFLERFDLIDDFALNLEANHGTLAGHSAEHEVEVAHEAGKLGSIDANHNELLLGWDTDMFPTDLGLSTYTMKRVIEQGGLQPGGLNFDAKVRRESTDIEDLFIGHINGMDTYARGLRAAAKLIADNALDEMVDSRYDGFKSTEAGRKIADGTASLADMASYAADDVPNKSGQQEKYESVFGSYAYGSV